MASWFTRRRTLGALITTIVIATIAAGVGLRATQRAAAEARDKETVTLEFAAADVATVEPKVLSRWLHVSGTLQPVNQTTVKSKVSGEVRQVTVREGEAVTSGQVLVRFDTSDLDAKLTERIGALEASRAQLALAEKTRTQNNALLKQGFISQNAYDSADSNLSVSQGTLKSNEAQVQLARNALRDAVVMAPLSGTVAKRHVQPGEKVPFDAPLITIVDLGRMELQAMVPANDIPELRVGMNVDLAIDGFGDRRFTGTIERINPTTEAGTRAILVFVHVPNPDAALRGGMFGTGKVTLAAGTPVPTLPAIAIRTEAGQNFVWTIESGKLGRRIVTVGRRDDAAGRVEIKTVLPPDIPILAAPFDNLKAGLPALVRAPATSKSAGNS
ncbi:MAG TPA: efflux RND transporter periplasmic adaptor subunit [Casimicrobiaceae bacterium]|nr:efflux RND transporter periplasmic adaptor subunit [Casimicrobiaceae bacterium]